MSSGTPPTTWKIEVQLTTLSVEYPQVEGLLVSLKDQGMIETPLCYKPLHLDSVKITKLEETP